MKKVVRLTENDLHQIITESVIRILKESKPGTFYRASEKSAKLASDPSLSRSERLRHGKRAADFQAYGDKRVADKASGKSQGTQVTPDQVKRSRNNGWTSCGDDGADIRIGGVVSKEDLGKHGYKPRKVEAPKEEPKKKKGLFKRN